MLTSRQWQLILKEKLNEIIHYSKEEYMTLRALKGICDAGRKLGLFTFSSL